MHIISVFLIGERDTTICAPNYPKMVTFGVIGSSLGVIWFLTCISLSYVNMLSMYIYIKICMTYKLLIFKIYIKCYSLTELVGLTPHFIYPSFYIIFMFLVYVSRLILLFVPPSSFLCGMSWLFSRCLLLICFRVLCYYIILSKVWVLYNVTRIMNPCFVFIWWRDILKVYKMPCILKLWFPHRYC
jgi:hypothetical protein